MSIFGSILSKIFPANHPAVAAPAGLPPAASPTPAATGATSSPLPPTTPANPPAMAAASAAPVDVEQVMSGLAAKNPEKLNWRTSIVDLMKLLSLDSSLTARKALAVELHYTGDTNDSATMNMWLHKAVMKKVAENGGKVPDDLKS